MTERSYISTVWELSPRLIEVAAPPISGGGDGSDTVAVQDLHDSLKSNTLQAGEADDSLDNMDDEPLIDSEGKTNLGGGVSVGISATLLNAQIAFEANYAPEQVGTATSNDVTGQSLTDTAAFFIANGVRRGAVIVNFTDLSVCEVLSVNSETQLDHRVLQQGTANDWTIGDDYKIWNVVQKEVSGGNVVAVDDVEAELSPIFPTAFTQVVRTSSSSATLQQLSEVQAQSFLNARVYINTVDGVSGTTHPLGTPTNPSINYSDASAIAALWGFDSYDLHHSLILNSGDVIADTSWFGHAVNHTNLTISAGADTSGMAFRDITLSGAFSGSNVYTERCWLGTITGWCGSMLECALQGNITVAAGCTTDITLSRCESQIAGTARPTFDLNGASVDLNVRGYVGGFTLAGLTQAQNVSLDVIPGTVEIDATCTAGTVRVRGVGTLIDNSGVGCTVDSTGFLQVDGDITTQFVEAGISVQGALRAMLAGVAGVLDGAATTTVSINNAGTPTKTRIIATVDASGNRGPVVLDLTD